MDKKFTRLNFTNHGNSINSATFAIDEVIANYGRHYNNRIANHANKRYIVK